MIDVAKYRELRKAGIPAFRAIRIARIEEPREPVRAEDVVAGMILQSIGRYGCSASVELGIVGAPGWRVLVSIENDEGWSRQQDAEDAGLRVESFDRRAAPACAVRGDDDLWYICPERHVTIPSGMARGPRVLWILEARRRIALTFATAECPDVVTTRIVDPRGQERGRSVASRVSVTPARGLWAEEFASAWREAGDPMPSRPTIPGLP